MNKTLLLIAVLLTGCLSDAATTTPSKDNVVVNADGSSVNTNTLSSISITPGSATITTGLNSYLTATGIYTDGSSRDITNQVTWVSTNPNIVSVNNAGVATGNSSGYSVISASLSGKTSSPAAITITNATLSAINITPTTNSVARGAKTTFTATGTFSDSSTGDVSGMVVWSTSDSTVANMNTTGIASALTIGSATIAASANGHTSNTATLLVTNAALISITITPASSTIHLGMSSNLIALATYSDGTIADITNRVNWSLGSGVATIASGIVTGVSPGSTTITAALAGITSVAAHITVNSAIITSIAITPTSSPAAPKGSPFTFTATATYSDSSTGNVSGSVTWTSNSPSIATINASGIVSTLLAGTTTIGASLNGVTATGVVFTVNPKALTVIAINASASVAAGLTTQLTATGTYTDASTADITTQVSWTSAATGTASVGLHTGLVTGVLAGTTTVSASLSSITSTSPTNISVTAALLNGITITGPTTITLGLTGTFTATGHYTDGSSGNVTGSVTWSSSTTKAVCCNTSGVATTVAQGATNIGATLSGITATPYAITVGPAVLVSISIAPSAPHPMFVAGIQLFTVSGLMTDGTAASGGALATIACLSSNTAVATFSGCTATGVATGTTQISATSTNGAVVITSPSISWNVVTQMGGGLQGGLLNPITTFSTVAGAGAVGGAMTTDGVNIYVADSVNGTIRQVVIASGAVSTLTSLGTFNTPTAITTDGTSLFVSAVGGIFKVTPSSGTLSAMTSANAVVSTLTTSGGSAACITTNGTNLYLLTLNSATITQVVISSGAVSTVATVPGASFAGYPGITTDGLSLYATDSITTFKIYKVSPSSGSLSAMTSANAVVSTFAGNGSTFGVDNTTGLNAGFNIPGAITTDGTYLYVAEYMGSLRRIEISTTIVTSPIGIMSNSTSQSISLISDGSNLYMNKGGVVKFQ